MAVAAQFEHRALDDLERWPRRCCERRRRSPRPRRSCRASSSPRRAASASACYENATVSSQRMQSLPPRSPTSAATRGFASRRRICGTSWRSTARSRRDEKTAGTTTTVRKTRPCHCTCCSASRAICARWKSSWPLTRSSRPGSSLRRCTPRSGAAPTSSPARPRLPAAKHRWPHRPEASKEARRAASLDPTLAGQALYQGVLKPLLPFLGGRSELYLSLDGTLNLVPFDVLHDVLGLMLPKSGLATSTGGPAATTDGS